MLKRLNVFILVVFLLGQTIIGPIGSTAGLALADEGEGVDKSKLEQALDEAKNFSEEDYTEDSYADFVEAVSAGQKIYDQADAPQDDVNEAVDEIKNAVKALQEKKPASEDNDSGNDDTEGEGGEVDSKKSSTGSNQPSITSMNAPMNVQPAEIDVDLAKFNITINDQSVEDAAETELEQGATVAGSFVFNANLEADGANIEDAWFTFELPDTILDFGNSFTGSQPATATSPAFEYSVSGQTVTVTLTEDVQPDLVSPAVKFNLNFNAEFDLDGNNLEQELEIPKADGTSGSDTITLTFKPNSSNEQVVQKKSNGVKTENGERYIEWEIWVNKNGQDLNNATLEDTPSGASHEIVDGSVNVTEYPIGLNGADESNGTAKVTNGDISNVEMNGKNAYKVTYKTKVDIADADGNYYSGQQYYSNNAVVKEGDQTIGSDNSGQNITFGTALDKSVKQGDAYKATWEIIYNYNEAPIAADDAVITDTVTGPHVLDTDSIKVYEVTVDDSGKHESEDQADPGSYSIVESSEGGFKIEFNADTDGKVTKAYRVEYETVYDSDEHPNFVVGGGEVENTVNSNAHDSVTKTHSIGEGILSKEHTVDFDSKEITWTITIKNTGTEDMTDVKVADDFTDKGEHTLVGDENDITVNGMTGHTTTVDQDPTKGFTITGGTIAEDATATIRYTTTFTIDADGSVNTDGYDNNVKVDWKDPAGNDYDLTKNSTYVPEPATANNGIKKGSFNYDTQEFTWQVQVNTNKQSIAGAILTDTLGDGHELKDKDDSSFTVKETTLGGSDENDTGGVDLDESFYTIDVAADGKTFTLTFDNSIAGTNADNKVYLVTYNTVDSDDILGIGSDNAGDAGNTYTNDAKFKTIGGKEFDIPSNDVVVNHANKLIGKSASANSNDGTYTWTLNVNHSHSNLGEVTVTDTPSENLMLLPGSIEYVYKEQDANNGNLSNDGNWKSVEDNADFTLTYTDEGGFELELGDMSKKAVDIRYKTLVLGEENEDITNEATITYGSEDETSENQKTDDPFSGNLAFSASSAHASVAKGSIKINKTGYNEATGATKSLDGVKFQLVKTIGGTDYIIKEGTTDENGELNFENVSYGTFKLVEETPDEYKPLTGYESFVVNADNDYTVVGNDEAVVNIINEEDIKEDDMCPIFTITVENVEGKPDANKKIKLVNENTGEEFEVETDDDGKIIEARADLPAGEYKVYENKETGNIDDDIYIGEITVNYEMEDYEDCSAGVRPEVTSVSGTKTWKDGGLDNRPDVTINLLADGTAVDSITIDKDDALADDENKWTYSFENLRKFDNAGENEIDYTVKEEEVTGYKSTVSGFDITNVRHSEDPVEVTVTKTWQDDDDATGDRPGSITVNLLQNGNVIETEEITEVNGWTYTFDNLTEFDDEGVAYEYTISEFDVPGYAATFNDFDITNTRSEKKDIEITKGWLDNDDATEKRPNQIEVELFRSIEGDAQPSKVYTYTVKAEDDWSLTIEGLPAFDANGQAYTYEIEEIDVDGYESTVKGFNITNLRVGTTEVKTTKNWDHKDVSEDLPTEIEIDLFRSIQNGEKEQVNEENTPYQLTANDWELTIGNLPEFDGNGNAYTYSVKERDVVEYNSEVSESGLDITNTRKTYAIGDYVWVDRNKDGIQDENEDPLEKVKVELYEEGNDEPIATTESDENGRYIFDELTAGDYKVKFTLTEEQEKLYRFTEEQVGNDTTIDSDADDETGWTRTIELNEDNVYLTPDEDYEYQEVKASEGIDPTWDAGVIELVDVSGTKTWDDGKGTDRPGSITVNLVANDEPVEGKSLKVSAEDDWSYSFIELDKYDESGVEIKYSVVEDTVDGYKASYDGYNITNTRYCEDFTVEVKDHENKPVTDEKYTFTSEDGKTKVTGTTDKDGKIVFDREDLPEGTYTVTDKNGNVVGEVVVEYSVNCGDNLTSVVVALDGLAVKVEDEEAAGKGSSLLPKTATQIFSYIALGLGLIALGVTVLFTRRQKTHK